MKPLPRNFYNSSALELAPELLGKVLVREINGEIISGRIVEVEAYLGFDDEAAHSFKGKTKRNSSLFGESGHAYVHSIHMQNCIDVVTQNIGFPTSLLIRALEPLEGLDSMREFRNKTELKDLTTGPGKLCQALNITKVLDGIDLTNKESGLYICDDGYKAIEMVRKTRIGISKAKEKDYRFFIKDNIFVSKK